MQPIAIVLHGASSSGKSSLAKALQAASRAPIFHVDFDAFECMTEHANFSVNTERKDVWKLHCQNLRSTLRTLAESSFDLIFDTVLRDQREFDNFMFALCEHRPTYVIGISCEIEEMEKRERNRGDREIGLAKRQFGHPEYNKHYSMRLDTTSISPAEGARLIRQFVCDRPDARYAPVAA
jgi:chloramphenicol 3-O phosphotransferase